MADPFYAFYAKIYEIVFSKIKSVFKKPTCVSRNVFVLNNMRNKYKLLRSVLCSRDDEWRTQCKKVERFPHNDGGNLITYTS